VRKGPGVEEWRIDSPISFCRRTCRHCSSWNCFVMISPGGCNKIEERVNLRRGSGRNGGHAVLYLHVSLSLFLRLSMAPLST
jgi:hypothetical protein